MSSPALLNKTELAMSEVMQRPDESKQEQKGTLGSDNHQALPANDKHATCLRTCKAGETAPCCNF